MTTGLYRHTEFILQLRGIVKAGECVCLKRHQVDEIAPHFWREEAPTIAEWFTNNCGAYDLDVTVITGSGDYLVRSRITGRG